MACVRFQKKLRDINDIKRQLIHIESKYFFVNNSKTTGPIELKLQNIVEGGCLNISM